MELGVRSVLKTTPNVDKVVLAFVLIGEFDNHSPFVLLAKIPGPLPSDLFDK